MLKSYKSSKELRAIHSKMNNRGAKIGANPEYQKLQTQKENLIESIVNYPPRYVQHDKYSGVMKSVPSTKVVGIRRTINKINKKQDIIAKRYD